MLWLLGTPLTFGAPFLLALGELGGQYRVHQVFEQIPLPLQAVAAVHAAACLVLAVLGFVAILGRPASPGVHLAVVAAPALAGLIAGRAAMGTSAMKVLATGDAGRAQEIGHALMRTSWPAAAGVLASAALLFAFCLSLALSHLALHKKGVGGGVSALSLLSWLFGVAAVGVTAWVRLHHWPRPPDYSGFAWLGAGFFALLVPFLAPASRGLRTFSDAEAAQAALRRVATLAWALPGAVALLAVAHAFAQLASGLERAASWGGVAAVVEAEALVRAGALDAAWNVGVALVAVAPLLFFGGSLRKVLAPRRPDGVALAVLAALLLGTLWYQSGRRSLIGLSKVADDPALQRFAGADVPQGSAPNALLDGPALWMIGGGPLQWDVGDGHLVALEQAQQASPSLTSVRVVASAEQPFFRLAPALDRLAQGRQVSFRLVERRADDPNAAQLSQLARVFEAPLSRLGALAFHWAPKVDLAHPEALVPDDPPHEVLHAKLTDHVLHLTAVPQGDRWELPLEQPPAEAVRALGGRLDESPFVVFSIGPNDQVETVAAAADLLGQGHVLELWLTPDVRELSQPPSE